MADPNEKRLKDLIDIRVLGLLAVAGMLGGGGGSAFTALASDEKVKQIVQDSPVIVELKKDMEAIKTNVEKTSAQGKETDAKVDEVIRKVDRLIYYHELMDDPKKKEGH